MIWSSPAIISNPSQARQTAAANAQTHHFACTHRSVEAVRLLHPSVDDPAAMETLVQLLGAVSSSVLHDRNLQILAPT